uniref:Putative secreted peptide n=1 Tax=Anopheles braziliensis TaxID=58242 RepID=A0A2M3ZTR0_9DIPT
MRALFCMMLGSSVSTSCITSQSFSSLKHSTITWQPRLMEIVVRLVAGMRSIAFEPSLCVRLSWLDDWFDKYGCGCRLWCWYGPSSPR